MKHTLFYVFLLGLLAACAERDWEPKGNPGLEAGETKLVIRTTLKLFGDQPANGITSRAAEEYTDAPGTSDDETAYQELVNKYSLTNDYENYVGKEVEVLDAAGKKHRGTLKAVDGRQFTVTVKEKVKKEGSKRPVMEDVDKTFSMDEVKYTKYMISFK